MKSESHKEGVFTEGVFEEIMVEVFTKLEKQNKDSRSSKKLSTKSLFNMVATANIYLHLNLRKCKF